MSQATVPTVKPAVNKEHSSINDQQVLPLVTSIYITQYLGVGFIYVGIASMLRQQSVSLESLAAVSLASIAWAIKPLWAPLIDRYGRTRFGHYRTWILLLQPLLALSGMLLVALPEPHRHLGTLGILIAIFTFVSATQDIAADGITARAVTDANRALANGIANAAQWFGNVLGGGLIVLIYDAAGWVPAMITLTVLTLLPLPFVLRHREMAPLSRSSSLREAYSELGRVFKQPGGMKWGLLVMPLFLAGTTSAYVMISPALVDAGWSLKQLGWVLGIFLAAPAAMGAILAGPLVKRLGAAQCALGTGVAATFATIALIPVVNGGISFWVNLVILGCYVASMAGASTIVYTINMSKSRSGSEATDFTTLAAVAMVASYLVGALALTIAGSLGYVPVLVGCAVFALIGTIVLVYSEVSA